jgi:hypothetical protein
VPAPIRGFAAAVSERLRGARYLLEDVGYVLGRVPRAVGRGASRFWRDLDLTARRRLLAALGAAVALLAITAVAASAAPCWLPGGDACPATDDAAKVVPADSLAYLHADLDQDSDQYQQTASIAARVPLISRQVVARALGQLPGADEAAPDFNRDIRPWFGGEAALAILPRGRGAEQLQLLESSDDEAALAYADRIAAGRASVRDYEGTEVHQYGSGVASAVVGGFLVIGTADGVHASIDVESGDDDSLAADSAADDAIDRLPDPRLAEAYVSRQGIRDLIASERGPFSSLEPFVDAGSSRGAAAALVADDDGFSLAIRSSLDPRRAASHPGFFEAFPSFEPTLTGSIAAKALAYVGFGDPGIAVQKLLEQASASAPGLAAGFSDLFDRLRSLGRVDLRKDLLPALGDEGALALQPGAGEETEPEGVAPVTTPAPFAELLAAGVDEQRAREALARLQGPIADALEPNAQGEQAPVFSRSEVDGVEAQSLRISPTVNLTYAAFDSKLVVATDPAGVEQVASGDGGLNETDRFQSATAGFPDEPSFLAYLNITDLLTLGEREGLAEDPAYVTFADELHKLEALGLSVSASEDQLATDAHLVIGE